MNAAKQDAATGLRPIELTVNTQRKPHTKNSIQFSPNGVTFPSHSYMAPFTEVRVQVKLPRNGSHHTVQCSGVVVECEGNKFRNQFQVSVAFLNLPKAVEHELRQACQPTTTRASATKFNPTSSH